MKITESKLKQIVKEEVEKIKLEEEESAIASAAANVGKMFDLTKQLEKAYKNAPEKHTDLETLRKQRQIIQQVHQPWQDNIDKLVAQQLAIKKGPNWAAEYRKTTKLIGVELRKTSELFEKMFNIAKEQNFQFDKGYYKIMFDAFKSKLSRLQDKLRSLQGGSAGSYNDPKLAAAKATAAEKLAAAKATAAEKLAAAEKAAGPGYAEYKKLLAMSPKEAEEYMIKKGAREQAARDAPGAEKRAAELKALQARHDAMKADSTKSKRRNAHMKDWFKKITTKNPDLANDAKKVLMQYISVMNGENEQEADRIAKLAKFQG